MLLPARVKFRKVHRGRRSGVATQGNDLAFGEFGLQAMPESDVSPSSSTSSASSA